MEKISIENSFQEIKQEALVLPEKIKEIKVDSASSLQVANTHLASVKTVRKKIAEFFDPNIDRLHKAHKEALDQKRRFDDPLKKAEDYLKFQIARYHDELERQRRIAEETLKKAEEERKRLEEEQIKKAIEAEEKGDSQKAEQILNEIPEVKPVPIIPPKPKLEGTSIRKILKWKIIDEKKVPREFLMLDSSKITRIVQETKGEIQIPGIEVYFETSIASRKYKITGALDEA